MISTICAAVMLADQQSAEDLRLRDKIETQVIEEDIARWHPGPEDRFQPDAKAVVDNPELEGKWATGRFMAPSTLTLTAAARGRYSVKLKTGGCLAHWELRRTAYFANGVLRLNRPLREYSSNAYDRLYAVMLAGKLRLISPEMLAFVTNENKLKDQLFVGFSSFSHISPSSKSRN